MLIHDWLLKLNQANLGGNDIIIEVTEGVLIEDDPKISNQLLNLRDAGIEVAVDDFGTGYSSLSYLKKFNIDYLKIDKIFIDELGMKSSNFALCKAIIAMAHELGLKVIAEGIENEAQLEILSQMNLDYGQGYLFSKPLPAADFEQLVFRQDWQPAKRTNSVEFCG